ncbi:hypothetical protein BDZ45DRAFT_723968 [Acephala macrosclerotiorum]|nr:hypothetical protein BDZ45DRAFT_723968 [Acephala macrosclerotiorum]
MMQRFLAALLYLLLLLLIFNTFITIAKHSSDPNTAKSSTRLGLSADFEQEQILAKTWDNLDSLTGPETIMICFGLASVTVAVTSLAIAISDRRGTRIPQGVDHQYRDRDLESGAEGYDNTLVEEVTMRKTIHQRTKSTGDFKVKKGLISK